MKRIFLIILFLITYIECSFPFFKRTLNINNGLSQQSVLAICQDDKGRMLFGTSEGINMYDGHNIYVYKGEVILSKKKRLWIGNYVTYIKADNKGNIFCISDHNLYRFHAEKNIYEQLTEGNKTFTCTIYNNLLWYIEGHELKTFNADSKQTTTIKDLPIEEYTSLEFGKENVFIGSTNGLYVYTKDLKFEQKMLEGINIFRLFESSTQELWIGSSDNGLYRYVNQDMIKVPITPNSNQGIKSLQIRDFIEDTEENIWFATLAGLQKYDKKQQEYQLIQGINDFGKSQNFSLYSLYIDKQNNFWIGTFSNGVSILNTSKSDIQFKYQFENSIQPIVNNILMDNNRNLWITDNYGINGLRCISPNSQIINEINKKNCPKLNSNVIKTIAYDKEKNLLYAGLYMGGLAIHNLNNNQTRLYQLPNIHLQEEHNNIVYHIELWKQQIYLSTPQAIYQFDEQTYTFKHITDINDNCNDFKITNDGMLITRGKNYIQIIPLTNPLNKETINLSQMGYYGEISRLLLGENGIYILTLGNGIIHYTFSTKEITCFNKNNSKLPSNFCYYALYTKNKKIVIASDQGVILFNPNNKELSFLNNSIRTAPIVRNNALYVSDENDIYVSNSQGIIKLSEENFKPIKNSIYSLFFTELYINNQKILPEQENGILNTSMPYTQSIQLKSNQNNLIIHIAHTDYVNDQLHQSYAYKLEGADKEWNYTKIPSLHYSSLLPGHYTLYVKIQGQENGPMASLSIHIARPIYATWWAICCYILLIILIIRTVYKYKNRQQELALSLKNERFEKQKIEQLNNEKLIFFTNISHEFRTPLTLINSLTDIILAQQGVPTTIYNMVYRLKKNTQYMNNLVSELLSFQKFSQHHSTLNLKLTKFNEFIEEMYLTFQDLAKQRETTFDLNIEPPIITGWFDTKVLEKVFFNLLSNAFKYTPIKGRISMHILQEGNKVKCMISDTGIGISKEDAKQLFVRFYQGSNQQNIAHTPGTGIGLALTKSIVDSHHGDIFVESEEGVGSTFTVILPIDKESYINDKHIRFIESDEICNSPFKNNSTSIDRTKEYFEDIEIENIIDQETKNKVRKILLVEDNKEILTILIQLFKSQYQILLATNGKEGLEKAFEHKPDLIISDIMMPEMNGTELCTQLKNNIDLCHIPIILLTALGGYEQNIEGLNRGADDYITKPFDNNLLLARANNLVRNRLLIQSQISQRPIEDIDLTSINPIDQNILKKTEEVLNNNLDNAEFGVTDLCKEVAMGRSLLYSKFKALTGMTPNNYILNFRLKHAASLLATDKHLSISEISDCCGFNSSVYFSRCFKSQYGISPQLYRKNHQKDKD